MDTPRSKLLCHYHCISPLYNCYTILKANERYMYFPRSLRQVKHKTRLTEMELRSLRTVQPTTSHYVAAPAARRPQVATSSNPPIPNTRGRPVKAGMSAICSLNTIFYFTTVLNLEKLSLHPSIKINFFFFRKKVKTINKKLYLIFKIACLLHC